MADDWDDWEDDAPAAPAPAAAGASEEPAAAVGAQEDGWGWDLEALEANVRQLEAARSGVDAAASAALLGGGALEGEEEDARKLRGLAGAAPAALQALQQGRRRAAALAELAKVTRLHLLAARLGFVGVAGSGEGMEELKAEMERVDAELRETAGDWATSISAWSKEDGHKLEEMASALHQSLHASGEDQDLSLFQQVVEQVFDALPDHSLRVSVEWIHPSAPKSKSSKRSSRRKARADVSPYLTQLIGMAADGENSPTHSRPTRIPVLTDAQIFQDAKDIARDEMTVNGDLVAGSIGYDAIVDRIQTQLEHLLAVEIGKPPQLMSMQLSDTLMRIAMEILNASNRTESGGSAYEVLGRFLTNHEMDHVLIRPASAKAPPIQIDMNMGAYVACATEANTSDWCFGVRVTLTAVTWYLVCDAADPTVELYEVKSTYRNRLAFPVGLTPFHPLNHMRKDHGAVDLKLMAPATITSDVLIGEELKSDAQPSIAFDELL